MPKIVALTTAREECQQSVIETLKDALAEAESGNIVAVAIAVVRTGGSINTARSECDDVGRLIGAVALAQFRLLKSVTEDD